MDELELLAAGLLVLAVIILGMKAAYYKGKAEQLEIELDRLTDDSGWEDEAKFWRKVCHPKVFKKEED